MLKTIVFSLIYWLGLGTSAVLGKVFKKRFLDAGFDKQSSWQKVAGKANIDKMF